VTGELVKGRTQKADVVLIIPTDADLKKMIDIEDVFAFYGLPPDHPAIPDFSKGYDTWGDAMQGIAEELKRAAYPGRAPKNIPPLTWRTRIAVVMTAIQRHVSLDVPAEHATTLEEIFNTLKKLSKIQREKQPVISMVEKKLSASQVYEILMRTSTPKDSFLPTVQYADDVKTRHRPNAETEFAVGVSYGGLDDRILEAVDVLIKAEFNAEDRNRKRVLGLDKNAKLALAHTAYQYGLALGRRNPAFTVIRIEALSLLELDETVVKT